MTSRTHQVLNSNLTSVVKEGLTSGTEFWDSSKTLKKLAEADYFSEEGHTGVKWPDVVQEMISESELLRISTKLAEGIKQKRKEVLVSFPCFWGFFFLVPNLMYKKIGLCVR